MTILHHQSSVRTRNKTTKHTTNHRPKRATPNHITNQRQLTPESNHNIWSTSIAIFKSLGTFLFFFLTHKHHPPIDNHTFHRYKRFPLYLTRNETVDLQIYREKRRIYSTWTAQLEATFKVICSWYEYRVAINVL